MNRLDFIFTNFVLWILKFIMPIIIGGAIVFQFISGGKINLGSIIQGVFYALSIGTFYILIKNKGISRRKIFLFLMGIGFVSRVLWLLNANTVPVSDFRTMYNAAEEILKGNFYAFQGTSYIARFPHLTIMVLYFSLMIKIFKAPIIVIKIINLLFGIISIYLIYKICKEIFKDEDYALIGGFMASIFPAMIIYTGVFASENIAIAFYLLSIYLFIKYINSKKGLGTLILSGLLLSLGNLFRMVGFIVLLAFIIYIVVYCKNKITYKIKIIATLLISFFIILISVSFTLKEIGVTEFHLWRGAEPAITNILKGTNIESMGAWTPEDSAIPEICQYDYEKMEKMSKEIIVERFKTTHPLKLISFYIGKIGSQWGGGDASGIYWTDLSLDGKNMIINFSDKKFNVFQLIYISIVMLSFVGLFNKKRCYEKDNIINLFYIILCGYGVSYLITENQGRYSYIVIWLFIIFAVSGIERVKEWRSS